MSLDSRTYNVMENSGTVSICAVISGSCSVGFRFEVNFTTSDDSAGIIHLMCGAFSLLFVYAHSSMANRISLSH